MEKGMVKISESDLKFILEDEFEEIYDLAKNNSFCMTCVGDNEYEMNVEEIHLDRLNDVIFHGKCSNCSGRMARLVEIGEQKQYFIKTKYIKDKYTRKN